MAAAGAFGGADVSWMVDLQLASAREAENSRHELLRQRELISFTTKEQIQERVQRVTRDMETHAQKNQAGISGWLAGKARYLGGFLAGKLNGNGNSLASALDRSRGSQHTRRSESDPSRSRTGGGMSNSSTSSRIGGGGASYRRGGNLSTQGGRQQQDIIKGRAVGFGSNVTKPQQQAEQANPQGGKQRRTSLLTVADWSVSGADSALLLYSLHGDDGSRAISGPEAVFADPRLPFPSFINGATASGANLRASRSIRLPGTLSAPTLVTADGAPAIGKLARTPTWRQVVRSRRFDPEELKDLPVD